MESKEENVYFPELNSLESSYVPRAKYGILNVGLQKDSKVITKRRWTYVYYDIDKGCLRYLTSYDLRLLREKVINNGFEWIIVDNTRAIDAYKLNNSFIDKRLNHSFRDKNLKLSRVHNTTGFFRVRRNLNTNNEYGSNWRYRYYTSDGEMHTLVSRSLKELHDRVIENGLEWIIIDKDKAIVTCEKYGYCLEDLL